MDNLVLQGVELTVMGMGTVFVFLVLLILATRAMSRILMSASARTTGEPIESGIQTSAAPAPDERDAVVISAAIQQFRKSRRTGKT